MQMPSTAEAESLWSYIFYIRWTYMALKRTLPTGFMADAAFRAAAVNMQSRQARPAPALGHGSSSASASATSKASSLSPAWMVCYKCGAVNDHKSPACTVISPTVTQSTRDLVKGLINAAPVTTAQRQQLLQMSAAYYAKIDREA